MQIGNKLVWRGGENWALGNEGGGGALFVPIKG